MCVMSKNSLLLAIGAPLLWSLSIFDVGHAVQTENGQAATPKLVVAGINRTALAPIAQLSSMPNPCHASGKGRTRAVCGKQSLPESGGQMADWSQYASAIFTVMLTIMLSTMIFLATFSLVLIVVAALSRRTPHQTLERAGNNLSLHGQEQRASYVPADTLCESDHAGWLRRAWVVGFVWFIGFLWLADSIGFFRAMNGTSGFQELWFSTL
jgi:hypothetical protein